CPAPLLSAAECARQNIPAASLLAPYFHVSRNWSEGDDIPAQGSDTLLSVINTSSNGLVVQVTVWNKYARPVFAFNVPMDGNDAASFSMRDVLNGRLNVNPIQRLRGDVDPCGLDIRTGVYAPVTGFGPNRFLRFANPDAEDAARATGIYPTPAFSRAERLWIWESLDESQPVSSLRSPAGSGILDATNPACGLPGDGRLSQDFSGFVTLDVLNYCTTRLPDDARRYRNDALATTGWNEPAYGFDSNVLTGDVLYVDTYPGGDVSGDSLVAMPFDPSLVWGESPTFYGRFASFEASTGSAAPERFRFRGDGRLPLGTRFRFRYFNDPEAGLRSTLRVFRWDLTPGPDGPERDLCGWLRRCAGGESCESGFNAGAFRLYARTYDMDANLTLSGYNQFEPVSLFLASQRLAAFDTHDLNPVQFRGGYCDFTLSGGAAGPNAWISVQHSGPAPGLTVGHAATVLASPVSCGVRVP
ncbi:MAG: hypothetical protein JNK60_18585, partial [Acidobacteria bacterium]|nr:hypothetical protein [Acidobacteriota bacterium]